jgi:peptidoglycan hydrolase-like protein with peptidoglycan-binding domain
MRYKEFKESISPLGNSAGVPGALATKNKPVKKDILKMGPPYPAIDSEAVRSLQRTLEAIGYNVGRTGVDGKYGPNTKAAVEAFKKDYNVQGGGDTFDSDALDTLKKVDSGIIPKVKNPTAVPGKSNSIGDVVAVPGSDDKGAIKRVIDAGPGFTDVETVDGKQFRRTGNRNWRNNNPGNLEFRGGFSQSKGAVGHDGRFAVFPTLEIGMKAKEDLVFGKNYVNLSIQDAIAKYAPETENNVNSYVRQIVLATNASPDTVLKDLSPAQRKALLDTITRVEGFRTGKVVALSNTNGTTTA